MLGVSTTGRGRVFVENIAREHALVVASAELVRQRIVTIVYEQEIVAAGYTYDVAAKRNMQEAVRRREAVAASFLEGCGL